jgi:hypothetical protein
MGSMVLDGKNVFWDGWETLSITPSTSTTCTTVNAGLNGRTRLA